MTLESNEAWHLWCPEHGKFWSNSKYGVCSEAGCGYQTNPAKEFVCVFCREVTDPSHVCSHYTDPSGVARRFHSILRELGELHDSKQKDYGREEDPLANVRGSSDFGVPPWVGAMIRATDKVRRLQKAARGGTLVNEGIIDSFKDLAVYAIIAMILWEEENRVE